MSTASVDNTFYLITGEIRGALNMNMIGYFDNPSGEVHRLKLNRAAINLSY